MSKLVSENINDYLPNPSEEEILKRLRKNLDPETQLKKSIIKEFFPGVKDALKRGAELKDVIKFYSFIGDNFIESMIQKFANVPFASRLSGSKEYRYINFIINSPIRNNVEDEIGKKLRLLKIDVPFLSSKLDVNIID